MGIQRIDVEVVIAHRNGGGRTKLRHFFQQRGIHFFAGAEQPDGTREGVSMLLYRLRAEVVDPGDGEMIFKALL